MPGPDDPPSTLTPSSTKTTTRSSGSQTARSTKRTAESAVPVPTPDAPLVALSVAAPRTSVTRSVVAPAPDVVQRTAPRVAAAPVGTRTAPRVVAPTTTTTSRAAAKPAPKPTPKPKAKAKPNVKAKPHHGAAPTKRLEPTRRAGVPRDAVRLGLPAPVLAAGPSDAELNGELLVAAALLLAAAAGGSLLLGIAARNSARHA